MQRSRIGCFGVIALITLMLVVGSWSAHAAPPTATSTELIEQARQIDGQTVVYQGEAIGELLRRGEFAWINASDGANAIGLYVPISLAEQVKTYGSYQTSGDKIQITGVFHRACSEHGGDLDIHVTELQVVGVGSPSAHPVSGSRVVWALVLTGLAGLLFVADRRRERKHRLTKDNTSSLDRGGW